MPAEVLPHVFDRFYRAPGQDKAGAASAFARYLELAPGAPDAAMVETYLGELQT